MYYFVFGPNNAGTTVISQYLAARTGAYLPPFAGFEGQHIPELQDMMLDNRWEADRPMDWAHVRSIWEQYRTQAGKRDFVEASPPNMMRVGQILETFAPECKAVFVICNPYMQIASCLRHRTKAPMTREAIKSFATRWLVKARVQAGNAAAHPQIPIIPYELFCARPVALDAALGLRRWPWQRTPRLAARTPGAARTKRRRERVIRDMSTRNIAFLRREDVARITEVLRPEATLLARFGYRLMDDDGYAARLAAAPDQARAGAATRRIWEAA